MLQYTIETRNDIGIALASSVSRTVDSKNNNNSNQQEKDTTESVK